jgi:hypothetical protein
MIVPSALTPHSQTSQIPSTTEPHFNSIQKMKRQTYESSVHTQMLKYCISVVYTSISARNEKAIMMIIHILANTQIMKQTKGTQIEDFT